MIKLTPIEQRKNLIFLQNGVLNPLLDKYNLVDNTQALIYYGIAKRGDVPIDGRTVLNPEGLTCVTGRWSADFAERLNQAGLRCKILPKEPFLQSVVQSFFTIKFS